MVQTDDVSRAVLTGGCCDQWKDVEGSPGTVGSLELGGKLQPRRRGSSAGAQSGCRQQVQGQRRPAVEEAGPACCMAGSPFS